MEFSVSFFVFFGELYTQYKAFFVLLMLILWFFFLIKGAGMLVGGASALAKRFHFSDMLIGLTIVAFGTSAPELVVNLSSSFKGLGAMSLGNVLGSNIANILLILGISAMVYPVKISRKLLYNEVFFSLIAILLCIIFVNTVWLDGTSGRISRIEGLFLLFLFGIFVYYIYLKSRQEPVNTGIAEVQLFPIRKSILWILLGLWALIIGGEWIVNGAGWIAQQMGLSQRLIGLTIIAIGTSLPELATSIVAAYKKQTDLALGNIIGSNLFNILFILGICASISDIQTSSMVTGDLLVLLVATVLIFVFWYWFLWKKREILRIEGLIMFLLYAGYLCWVVLLGN